MVKRIFDLSLSIIGLVIFTPILLPVCLIVFLQDFKSPFYIAPRVGKDDKPFKMIKLRSMVVNADKTGVDSTSSNDSRITTVGKLIRKFKFDELTQLFNVLLGDMSFVGPRPNVKRETDLYTIEEKKLLKVRPGITDFSSIVFSDEGEILSNYDDPDIAYNQLIRPWKSRSGIFYVEKKTILIDIKLIYLTIVSIISKKVALRKINHILLKLNADKNMIKVSLRTEKLQPYPPPGSKSIVTNRDGSLN